MKKYEQRLNNPIYNSGCNNDKINNSALEIQFKNKKRTSSIKEILGSENVIQSSFAYQTEFGIKNEEKIPNKGLEIRIKETRDSFKEHKKTRKNSCHYFGKTGGFYCN
jgi:hypothetical protein